MRIAIMMPAADRGDEPRDCFDDLVASMLSIAPEHEYLLFHRVAESAGRFEAHANVRELRLDAPNAIVWEQMTVPLAAWKHAVDVIFNPTLSGPLLSRCPVVMRMQEPDAWLGGRAWLERLRNRTLYPMLCNSAAGLLPASRFDLEECRRILGLPLEHAAVSYPCLAKHLRPIDDRALLAEFRGQWGLPQPFLLALAHVDPPAMPPSSRELRPDGQPDAVLRAFLVCRDEIPHHLVFLGRRVEEHLRARGFSAVDLARVKFIESMPHEDLPKLYGCAEASFTTTEHDGSPTEMMESMACGCPVIASRTGACPEIGGEAAVYVDSADPNDVARKVVWLAKDAALRTGLKLKVRQRAELFGWERAARSTLDCLESAVRRAR